MTGQQDQIIEDCIQPRSRAITEKVDAPTPWMSIAPDEVTIRRPLDDPDQPSCAELIRMMSASYRAQRS